MSDDFRDGIINLYTRQFGTVVEILIKFLYSYQDSLDLSFDLIDCKNKIEVKGSRVFKKINLN